MKDNFSTIENEDHALFLLIKKGDKDAFVAIYHKYHPYLYSLALRNPFLWKTQLTKRIVWNAQDFDSHLRTVHGMKLSDYLSKHNKYCALIGKDTIREHHSDCDGDLLSISIPEGIEGQTLLREFELPDVLQDELDWNQSYLDREASANDDIDWKN